MADKENYRNIANITALQIGDSGSDSSSNSDISVLEHASEIELEEDLVRVRFVSLKLKVIIPMV